MIFRLTFLLFIVFFLGNCRKKRFENSSLIGHAGAGLTVANSPYHDNTAESVNYAIQMQGIDGVEVDIQISADGTAWLYHDPTTDLETDGKGCVNSLSDEYLESLKYATFKREKLLKLKDLQFPLELKNLYLDIRTRNQCESATIQQEDVINAISSALYGVSPEKINVIVLIPDWIEGFHAMGWNVYYEAQSAAEYLNLEAGIFESTAGTCLRSNNVSRDDVAKIQESGKKVMFFDVRSPTAVRKALKKNPDIISVDDLKGALIEKY